MDNEHIAALSAKHADLEQRIFSESRRPAPDENLLHQLKREKLKLKQAIVGV